MWNKARKGAFHGIEVFLWYAVAEYVLLAISVLVRSHKVMFIQQWRGTAVLFACYVVLGMLVGAVAGLLVRGPDPDASRIRKALILTVLAAFALNTVTAAMPLPTKIALAGATALIAAALVFNLTRVKGDSGLRHEPLLLFGVLVSTGWTTSKAEATSLSPVIWVPVVIGGVALFLVAAVMVKRLYVWSAQNSWAVPAENFLKAAAILLLGFGPSLLSWAEAEKPVWPAALAAAPAVPPPNIVLVTLDTVSAGHMGIYGYSRANTPRLREFLNESTFYTNFIAASPLTLTSHASIFTGLYPPSHGAYKGLHRYATGRPLARNIPTMAQLLGAAGYRTMAVVANRFYLIREFGTLRGFSGVEWLEPSVLLSPERDYLLRNRFRSFLKFDGVVQDLDNSNMTAEDVNRKAFSFLDESRQHDAPFFLFLNYMDAHTLYLPPAPYSRLYPGRDLGFERHRYMAATQAVNGENRPIDPAVHNHLVSQYDGAVAYLDQKMSDLIAHLKANGQFDRTLIVITSDHGESFGERNILGHDTSVYQDQVHVPLIVKYPGQTQPARVDRLASHVDLMPTVLDITGIPVPAGVEGIDLRRLATAPERAVVSEMHGSEQVGAPRFRQIEWALYSGSQKMIYSTKGMRELYDLSSDPFERHNLYRPDAPETAALRSLLTEWSRRSTPRFLDAGQGGREVEKRLESLGYAHGVD